MLVARDTGRRAPREVKTCWELFAKALQSKHTARCCFSEALLHHPPINAGMPLHWVILRVLNIRHMGRSVVHGQRLRGAERNHIRDIPVHALANRAEKCMHRAR
jgi:hypothetical protein